MDIYVISGVRCPQCGKFHTTNTGQRVTPRSVWHKCLNPKCQHSFPVGIFTRCECGVSHNETKCPMCGRS